MHTLITYGIYSCTEHVEYLYTIALQFVYSEIQIPLVDNKNIICIKLCNDWVGARNST